MTLLILGEKLSWPFKVVQACIINFSEGLYTRNVGVKAFW